MVVARVNTVSKMPPRGAVLMAFMAAALAFKLALHPATSSAFAIIGPKIVLEKNASPNTYSNFKIDSASVDTPLFVVT